jgi:hypothetical protein
MDDGMMSEINLLVFLLLGHVLADFYCQPLAWVRARNQQHFAAKVLYLHGSVHTLITFGILLVSHIDSFGWLLVYALGLGFSHIVIDGIKSYFGHHTRGFLYDQIAHVLVILCLWLSLSHQWQLGYQLLMNELMTYEVLLVLVAYLFILKPMSVMMKLVLQPWSYALAKDDESGDKLPPRAISLASAGTNIGYLERILILTFILLNQLSAIGFLLAAKSVFRFGDLRNDEDKKLTEYVLLGTLTSFTVTILLGLLVTACLGQLPVGK